MITHRGKKNEFRIFLALIVCFRSHALGFCMNIAYTYETDRSKRGAEGKTWRILSYFFDPLLGLLQQLILF